jgi:ferredoxin
MKKSVLHTGPDAGSTDPAECNGCGVCMLSCPVWRQRHTKELTYCGRNRASIGGAKEEDLAASAAACILCGSCEPLCPMGIRTQQTTMTLRLHLVRQGLLPKLDGHGADPASGSHAAPRLVLLGKALGANEHLSSAVLSLVGRDVLPAPDDGRDIASAFESGREIPDARIASFTASLMKAKELIVSDGLLFNMARRLLPASIRLRPLGQALLANPKTRAGLKATDFYMIETRAYNANRKKLVSLYDAVRRETGCSMNLDLQRVATPTGASSYQHREGLESVVSIEEQVTWLLEGRNAERIVAEDLDDLDAFKRFTSLPVVHLAEVATP